jgi:CPA1 family monovalent cation:H+ antiporter
VVTAGLVVAQVIPNFSGKHGPGSVVMEFWSLFDETLNMILFLLIGLQLLEVPFGQLQIVPILLSVPLAVGSRLASVALPLLRLGANRRDRAASVALLTWAGLRGGISIALVLTLPPVPVRGQLLAICYIVVIFTIVVQGATMPGVIRRLYHSAPAASVPDLAGENTAPSSGTGAPSIVGHEPT